jgi:hypothetical protein
MISASAFRITWELGKSNHRAAVEETLECGVVSSCRKQPKVKDRREAHPDGHAGSLPPLSPGGRATSLVRLCRR